MATWDRSVALPRAMMIDASGCNGGVGPKKEVMEAELVLPLISGGGRGEPLGGRVSDGTSDGKDDPRPDHRKPESERLDRGELPSVKEDPSVAFFAVGGEGNADSEEVSVEANGGGAAGEANERSGEQDLENGGGHLDESAAFVAMNPVTAENCVVGIETEMAGNDSGETLESRAWGHVEVVEVKAETNFGREPLNCQNTQEQLMVGTATPDICEEGEEANPVVELGQEKENDIEVDDGKSSHAAEDEKSRIHKQVERESHLVPVVNDGACPVVDHTMDEPESSHDAADVEFEIDQVAEPGSEEQQVNKLCTAVTELHHQADLESEMKEQLNETVITGAGDQIEQAVAVEDVNQCVDTVVTGFDHQVESELERKGQLTETDIHNLKDGSKVESRYLESEQNYSQSSISSVTQYYHGNQFIKFGEIIATLDEAQHNRKRGPFFIIRVPRFTGDELWAKIQQAQDEVDEKTNSRDLINKEVQMQKAICLRVLGELATAGYTELAAREAFEAKRAELAYVASVITMLSTSRSIEEIDTQIKEMEFNHQHVTVPLKEEKKYMQELKKLKCLREDMSSLMASKNEIDKALKDQDSIDQKLKDLKKELDSLRSDLAQAEANAIAARKRYDDEDKILQNIRKQFNAANEIRQDAFSHLQHLKGESFEKSRYFHKYKNDQTTARLYASSGDKASLWLHCSSQVEEVMNMWNNNDNFRKQYVDCNKNSVLRRLKTLDARSLGPGENPTTVPGDMNKVLSTAVPTKVSLPKTLKKAKELPPATQTVQKSQPAKMRKSNVATTKATRDSSAALVPVTELIENTEKEKSMTKEEEELARKEEEVRKEKEAAGLKERLKLEQRVKAKEAEERKKQQAEKAQARAEYRAQKEAELKEKKRTKKEKKKGSDAADSTQTDDKEVLIKTTENNAAETFQEQQPEAQAASSSKNNAQSTVAARKFNSVQPVPLLLRNRHRRKIDTWTWGILTAMLFIVLFLAGNYVYLCL